MRKIFLLLIALVGVVYLGKSINKEEQPALVAHEQAGNKMQNEKVHSASNVLPFPERSKMIEAPSLSELEDKYQDLSELELKQELLKIDDILKRTRMVEKANAGQLTRKHQEDLLLYMRSKAVITLLLFHLQKEAEET